MAEVLVWPFISFAALAFGLDWNGKQANSFATTDDSSELLNSVVPFRSSRGSTGEHQRTVGPEQPADDWSDEQPNYSKTTG